jgi:ankyrin repeat protein
MRDRNYTTMPSGPEAPIEVNCIGLTPVMVAARAGHAAVVKGWVEVETKYSRWAPQRLRPPVARRTSLRAGASVLRAAEGGGGGATTSAGSSSPISSAKLTNGQQGTGGGRPKVSPKAIEVPHQVLPAKPHSTAGTGGTTEEEDSRESRRPGSRDTQERESRVPYCVCERDPNGWTALHWALHSGCLEGAAYLVQGGADVNATDFVSAV